MTTTTTTDNTKQLSAIERALAAVRARKAAKGESDEAPTVVATPKTRGLTATAKVVAAEKKEDVARRKAEASAELDRIKAERRAQREADRTAKAAERAEEREARAAEKGNTRSSAHMKKIETARSKLPSLEAHAANIFADATSNLTTTQLEALAVHLQFHNRLAATTAAPTKPIPVGTQVTIVGGEHRFVGKVGTVVKSQKLRSFVSIPGSKRDHYTFTAYLKPVEA
jgi:3D (Asp-Asp-Asp) domain-containing protein